VSSRPDDLGFDNQIIAGQRTPIAISSPRPAHYSRIRVRDKPPSAASSAPATNGQRAEARKSTARAISAAEPRRPRGVAALADGYAAYNALGDTSMLTMFSPEFYDNEALPT
jgi:hypothetical protein